MFGRKKYEPSESEIQQALEGFRKGSAEAFKLLYNKYQQKVYRFCLRMLSDKAAAEDAYQETFIKVYEHRQDFRGTNFPAWLFTIARHVCLNQLRSKKEYDSFDEVFHGVKNNTMPDFSLKESIDKSIALLPVPMREALILREYEECSYQEIAQILNIDISLAKIRVYRARILLRKLLKPLEKELHES